MSILATQARQVADNPIWPAIQVKLRDLYVRQLVAADVQDIGRIISLKNKLNVLEDIFSTITNLCYEFSTKGDSHE